MNSSLKLRNRFKKVWESSDFATLFEKNLSRKSNIIKKGTIIFNDGDPLGRIYFIQEGFVKLYRVSEEGRETTSYLLGPGYLLGIRALFSKDESARHSAEAITDLKTITISRKEFFEILADNPEYLIDLIHVILDRLVHTERKLEAFIIADTTVRVANFLSDLAMRFGTEKNDIITLPLDLTHQRIAEFVGSFRETVTLALHRLEKEGAIKIDRAKVTILDLKKLNRHALLERK